MSGGSGPPPAPAPVQPEPSWVFIGFRGTHSRNAEAYRRQDWGTATPNGSGEELGKGIYVTDKIADAHYYAERAAQDYQGTVSASICAIFMKSDQFVRTMKVFLPPSVLYAGDFGSSGALLSQAQWITSSVLPQPANELPDNSKLLLAARIMKLSSEKPLLHSSHNQMLIPVGLIPSLHVSECIDYPRESGPSQLLSRLPMNMDYRFLYQAWRIFGTHRDDMPPVQMMPAASAPVQQAQ
ncbi:hypothetical protein HGRIS_004397 [Hohenbuehelia grisea]